MYRAQAVDGYSQFTRCRNRTVTVGEPYRLKKLLAIYLSFCGGVQNVLSIHLGRLTSPARN